MTKWYLLKENFIYYVLFLWEICLQELWFYQMKIFFLYAEFCYVIFLFAIHVHLWWSQLSKSDLSHDNLRVLFESWCIVICNYFSCLTSYKLCNIDWEFWYEVVGPVSAEACYFVLLIISSTDNWKRMFRYINDFFKQNSRWYQRREKNIKWRCIILMLV